MSAAYSCSLYGSLQIPFSQMKRLIILKTHSRYVAIAGDFFQPDEPDSDSQKQPITRKKSSRLILFFGVAVFALVIICFGITPLLIATDRLYTIKQNQELSSTAITIPTPAFSKHMEEQALLNKLGSWVSEAAANKTALVYYVGVDIGATRTRVGLRRHGDPSVLIIRKFDVDRVSSLLQGIGDASALITKALNGVKPVSAGIDAAGPISLDGSAVEITNWPDKADRTLRTELLPPSLFPKGHTYLLNDLESCCYGLLALHAADQLGNYFSPLWGCEKATLEPVHSMGTGLGVGILLRSGNTFRVVPVEIGHTLLTFHGPGHVDTAKDKSLADFISAKIYSNQHGPEFEDICSGRGLEWTYEWVVANRNASVDKVLPAAQVAERALRAEPCPFAAEALEIHYKFLMRVAQNTCVGMQTKGVILAGDNQVSNHKFLRAHLAQLKGEFLTHPKQPWLLPVSVVQQETSTNINMMGALYVAESRN